MSLLNIVILLQKVCNHPLLVTEEDPEAQADLSTLLDFFLIIYK